MTPEDSLKTLSVFVLLIVSFIGIVIPVYLVRVDHVRVKFAFDMLRCVSIGLIIGVALLHMLPDANGTLDQAQAEHNAVATTTNSTTEEEEVEPYPFAFFFAGLGICLMVFLEQIIEHLAETTPTKKEPSPVELQTVSSDSSVTENAKIEVQAESAEGHGHSHGGDLHSHHDATLAIVSTTQDRMKAYVIEISISFHSVLIGIGLGVLKSYAEIEVLLIALSFHQLFEGIALGGAVVNTNQTKWFLAGLIFGFSFSCPIGVAIGAAISKSFDPDAPGGLWTEGVLYALACGTLLYIGIYDLMGQSFQKKNPGLKKFGMVFAILMGLGLMALLAVWA